MKLPDLKFGYSFASINTPLPITLETKQVRSINGESLSIQEVSAAEYSQVECKIRNAAESGSMIGLDELTDSGLWNRSFLRKTHVLGTYNEKNEMVGVALFGPSSICRTDSIIISGYVILDQRYQFQGLESVLVETIIDISKKLSFEGVLLDVYRTEWKFIGLLMDMGFKVTGSLPKCGYLKGKGYIDSVLLYKEFVIGSSKL